MAFKKGVSGNPKGRPTGSKKKVSLIKAALDSISKEQGTDVMIDIIKNVVVMAQDGDMTAIKMLLDRVEPPLRPIGRKIVLDESLPDDLLERANAFIRLGTDGTIAVDEVKTLLSCIADITRAKDSSELEPRIIALENNSSLRVA